MRAELHLGNDTDRPRTIYVEPWGEDFTLRPGEALEVAAFSKGDPPYFHMVWNDDGTQIFCENTDDFVVTADGRQLECGHQRPW